MVHNLDFRNKLINSDEFVITFELVPGQTSKGQRVQKIKDFAEQAAADHLLDALSLTDNPGGNPLLSPDVLGKEIINLGMEAIVHVTCRDANRLGLFSRSQQLDSIGVQNLLVLTGDYPAENSPGTAKPCFDLDSVSLLCFLNQMNGLSTSPCMNVKTNINERTNFLLGCAVCCTKYSEDEQINQYSKLLRKIRNGAQYVITQLGYDARKFHELIQFKQNQNLSIPVLGTVYILSEPAARFMNRGKVPGAFVSNKLYETISAESKRADKGKRASLERAARLMAVLKGIGYRGAHISGPASYNDIREVLSVFEEVKNNWTDFIREFSYGSEQGFYLYEEDKNTGLNLNVLSPTNARSLKALLAFQSFEAFHATAFNEHNALFPILKNVAIFLDSHRRSRSACSMLEHASKNILFKCRMCGDCVLSEMAYVCPESQCPKFLRNGPCGGSRDTKCEVFPDRRCAWVNVYRRLKAANKISDLNQGCIPPRNWALDQTPSWQNFYLGLDHQRLGRNTECQHPK